MGRTGWGMLGAFQQGRAAPPVALAGGRASTVIGFALGHPDYAPLHHLERRGLQVDQHVQQPIFRRSAKSSGKRFHIFIRYEDEEDSSRSSLPGLWERGARSIIGAPRSAQIQAVMNLKVKFGRASGPSLPACCASTSTSGSRCGPTRMHPTYSWSPCPGQASPYALCRGAGGNAP